MSEIKEIWNDPIIVITPPCMDILVISGVRMKYLEASEGLVRAIADPYLYHRILRVHLLHSSEMSLAEWEAQDISVAREMLRHYPGKPLIKFSGKMWQISFRYPFGLADYVYLLRRPTLRPLNPIVIYFISRSSHHGREAPKL
jgi:hypothetical protein